MKSPSYHMRVSKLRSTTRRGLVRAAVVSGRLLVCCATAITHQDQPVRGTSTVQALSASLLVLPASTTEELVARVGQRRWQPRWCAPTEIAGLPALPAYHPVAPVVLHFSCAPLGIHLVLAIRAIVHQALHHCLPRHAPLWSCSALLFKAAGSQQC